MSLGKYIANRRKSLGMTQEELAEKMHVSKSAIAKWETDGGIPDRDNLSRVAEIINVSVGELHKIINNTADAGTFDVNITPELIAVLESFGYTVIPPGRRSSQENDNTHMTEEN